MYFWTATINDWMHLLRTDDFKKIIIDSFNYLHAQELMKFYALVIMPNHIHVVMKPMKMNGKEKPHVSFLKHTAHQFQKKLKFSNLDELDKYAITASNKKHEFWQRDAFAFELKNRETAMQKINYIHNNPIKENWKLCNYPEEYQYSSAKFYLLNESEFSFLTHIFDEM